MWSATAGAAVAPLPIAPDNLVVFPDRDFVTIEGFADRVNQEATIEVERPGVGVVGSAKGVVSGTDVAFEINHPGGYCWGAGTGLNVTPDIRPGDVVSIAFGGVKVAATTRAGCARRRLVHRSGRRPSGATMKVVGHIATTIDPANFEQRIIEPALVDTRRRRDIRALIGPMEPAPKGGYSSGWRSSGDVFTATYVFDDPAVAAIAAGATGERAMTWELTDAGRQPSGPHHRRVRRARRPGHGRLPQRPAADRPGCAHQCRGRTRLQRHGGQCELDAGGDGAGNARDHRLPRQCGRQRRPPPPSEPSWSRSAAGSPVASSTTRPSPASTRTSPTGSKWCR